MMVIAYVYVQSIHLGQGSTGIKQLNNIVVIMVVILVVFVDDDDISIVDCGLECVEGMLYDGVYLMMGTVLDDSLLLVVGVYEYVPAYLPKTHIILPTILLQLCKSLQLSKCFLFSVWFVFIVLVIIILFIAFIRVCVLVGCYNYYAGQCLYQFNFPYIVGQYFCMMVMLVYLHQSIHIVLKYFQYHTIHHLLLLLLSVQVYIYGYCLIMQMRKHVLYQPLLQDGILYVLSIVDVAEWQASNHYRLYSNNQYLILVQICCVIFIVISYIQSYYYYFTLNQIYRLVSQFWLIL